MLSTAVIVLASTPCTEVLSDVFAWHSVDSVLASWRGVSQSIQLVGRVRVYCRTDVDPFLTLWSSRYHARIAHS